MPKIVFVDKNESLVSKVRELNIAVRWGDIFDHHGVIVSTSNPHFTMAGGLDAQIKDRYPKTCALIDPKKGNQRIRNIIFTVTVGKDLRSTPELIQAAIRFALDNVDEYETLLLSGLGTGIGGLDEDIFVEILKDVIKEITMKPQNVDNEMDDDGVSFDPDPRDVEYSQRQEDYYTQSREN